MRVKKYESRKYYSKGINRFSSQKVNAKLKTRIIQSVYSIIREWEGEKEAINYYGD